MNPNDMGERRYRIGAWLQWCRAGRRAIALLLGWLLLIPPAWAEKSVTLLLSQPRGIYLEVAEAIQQASRADGNGWQLRSRDLVSFHDDERSDLSQLQVCAIGS